MTTRPLVDAMLSTQPIAKRGTFYALACVCGGTEIWWREAGLTCLGCGKVSQSAAALVRKDAAR